MSGTSHPFGKEWAADLYAVTRPDMVVDLGAGSGTWRRAFEGRHDARLWVAVERWEPYIERYSLRSLYDAVEPVDARDYIACWTPFDASVLVIAGDVLEHMPQVDAEALLGRLQGCHALISVPVVHYDQGPIDGNPHEAHLWHPTHEWAMDVFRPSAHVVGDVVGAYWRCPA